MKKIIAGVSALILVPVCFLVLKVVNNGPKVPQDLRDAVGDSALEQIGVNTDSTQKGFTPGDNNHPGLPGQQPGHPTQPGQPTQPGHPTQPGQPPQPGQPTTPPVVDTTQATHAGQQDGMRQGRQDGEMRGRRDGADEGRREGDRRGREEGYNAGRSAGRTAGYNTDQSDAARKGANEGAAAGTEKGQANGKDRCYNEGYTAAYNVSYVQGKAQGQQDTASSGQGYTKGKADAAGIEADKGAKAGYQNGFTLRETEIINSFPAAMPGAAAASKSVRLGDKAAALPIKLARGGYATPEEKKAYDEAYRRAYDEAMRDSYRRAKEMAFNEEYRRTYNTVYNTSYQAGYQNGFSEGRETAYQEAYKTAYNAQYNTYYADYSAREYADSRNLGLQTGAREGQAKGFTDGCKDAYNAAYKKGYEETAALVYPAAFASGKLAGIAAAEKFYAENSVLSVADVTLADENNNGKFEADENLLMNVSLRNLGFKASGNVTVSVVSEKNELVLEPNLAVNAVGPRGQAAVQVKLGRILDTVASDADKLVIKFTENGKADAVSRQEKSFVRTNIAMIGVVTDDKASIRKKPQLIFTSTIAELSRGNRVIILEKGDSFTKVKRPKSLPGDWDTGYIRTTHIVVQ